MKNIFKKPLLILFVLLIVSSFVSFYKYKINNDFIVYTTEESIPESFELLPNLNNLFK